MNSQGHAHASSAENTARLLLCQNALDGLHAMAQPLTILRSGLGNRKLSRMGIERLRELISDSALEVERLCGLFNCLRDLIQVECEIPELAEAPIAPIITEAMDRVVSSFSEHGVSLRTAMFDKCPPLLIDTSRTVEALANILVAIELLSRRGDLVEIVTASNSIDGVRVIIRNLGSEVDHVRAEIRVGMSLADAIMRSQHATLSWSFRPLKAEIDFPRA